MPAVHCAEYEIAQKVIRVRQPPWINENSPILVESEDKAFNAFAWLARLMRESERFKTHTLQVLDMP
jgi:hypothetical protein